MTGQPFEDQGQDEAELFTEASSEYSGMEEFGEDVEFSDDLSAEDERPELVYPNAEAWVREWLIPHYRRNPKTRRWDPQWWRYEEIITLLESLWESWEYMRLQGPTGIVVFFRDYLWPVMDVITSDDGPLWSFDETRNNKVPDVWNVRPAPEGMFPDD